MEGPLEGWLVASKGLAALPRTRGSALAHCCGRDSRVVLPLPRAAAVSTGLRVHGAGRDARVALRRVRRRACVVVGLGLGLRRGLRLTLG